MISQMKQSFDLAEIVSNSGVKLQQRGRRYVGLCPFHSEKTPSFTIYERNGVQRCHCFGCGFDQDVIGFVREYFNLSFKAALRHLGIKSGPITPKIRRDIAKRRRQAELIKEFRQWCWKYCLHISDLCHETKKLMMNGIPPEDLDLYALLLHELPVLEYKLAILISGTDEEKFELYKDKETHGKFQLRNTT